MTRFDIAIIGGGLVGASLALALQPLARERGWKILLVEPFAPGNGYQPSYDARSSALAYGTRLIYEHLGVWEAIAQHAEPIRRIHVSDRGRFGATTLHAAEEAVPALGYVVENAWLGHCLWAALDPDCITRRCPAEVVAAHAEPDGYRLVLADESQLHCGLAVLADGGRSGLRDQLGIEVKVRAYDQTALIANVSFDQPHNGQAFERFTDDGPLALLPLSDNRCALVWTRKPAEAQALRALPDADFLAQLQHSFGYRLGSVIQVGARHLYPLALSQAHEQVRRHLVVLGNAAHSLHPIAGQGFNLSLRDVQALAQALQASDGSPGELAPLRAYVAAQQRDQQWTVGFSDQVTRLFSQPGRWVAQGRNLGLLGLDLLPPARHWFARQAMGLGTGSGPGSAR